MPVPVDLSKLSDVVKNDVVKKTVYDKLVAKSNIIDTIAFVLKTEYDTDKTELGNKIPNTSGLVKKTYYNTKIAEIKKKLTDHNHDKYITTPEFNTLAATVFNTTLAQENLVAKTDFDAKLSSLNRKIALINQKIYLLKMG